MSDSNDSRISTGTDLLVKPVTSAGQTSLDVYFPGGENEVGLSFFTTTILKLLI